MHFVSGTVKTPQYPTYENLYSLYYRDLFVHQQKRATLACDHPDGKNVTNFLKVYLCEMEVHQIPEDRMIQAFGLAMVPEI